MKKSWFLFYTACILLFALGIRLYKITESPPAHYWEEVALGYDAYSLLKTGKDHHGNPWPLVAFESFGDWKPSGYFYALVPFVAFFDLSVLAIRLPSVLAGVGIVGLLGWLTWLFLPTEITGRKRKIFVLVALALGSISPWLIQFSRGGWEVNLATFFLLGSVCFGWASVSWQRKNHKFSFLLFSFLLAVLAVYTYHSARVIAPLLGGFLGFRFFLASYKAHPRKAQQQGAIILLLAFFCFLPFLKAWGSPIIGQRLAETSIFSDTSLIEKSNTLKDAANNEWWSRIVYHRYLFYGQKILSQFFSHLRPDFLFATGDMNARHSSQYFGLFYPFEIAFLLIGGYVIFRFLPKEQKYFLFFWLVIGILPASISYPVPHALRILPVAPLLLFTVICGLEYTLRLVQLFFQQHASRFSPLLFRSFCLGLLGVFLVSFMAFYRHLLYVYPYQYGAEWQQGYQEMVEKVVALQAEHPDYPVFITRSQGRPAMYYWFYTKTDPRLVQEQNAQVKKDQGEFLEFQDLHFVRSLDEVSTTPALVAHYEEGWKVDLR